MSTTCTGVLRKAMSVKSTMSETITVTDAKNSGRTDLSLIIFFATDEELRQIGGFCLPTCVQRKPELAIIHRRPT
ncbi:hypothetical protein CHS0354_022916 [Potamilus streckersoni]|uniref:Uncharacterized protein n=1 Tax=Potamilus streckersoni TaxID=2493646 RepID=A0AAE0S1X7_9BIVA|nr:hypothetical protein CHS0354_022916 [Potamilus streckersoni]